MDTPESDTALQPGTLHDDLVERVVDAVQGELKLLAKELRMEPCGVLFRNIVGRVTAGVIEALIKGDDSLSGVQTLIDSIRLSNKLRKRRPK